MSQTSCEQVIRAEHAAIEEQRAKRGIDRKRAGYVGLALSGGGIRSASFAIAIERVRVDFGVSIDFAEDSFKDLAPGSFDNQPATSAIATAVTKTYSVAALQLSKRGYAVADIRYRNRVGRLIVVKSGMVTGVPIDTVVYKLSHADFPNQSTSDPFFSERQFEAYREIGYEITKQMLRDPELKQAVEDPRARLDQIRLPLAPQGAGR